MAQYLAFLVLGALAGAAPAAAPSQTESCKDASFLHASWAVKGFRYHSLITYSTPSHPIATGFVDFNLTNVALPYTLSCSATSSQMSDFFYGNQWYLCTDSLGNDAEFQFDKSSGRLDLQQKWACANDSPPVSFMGKGTANVTMVCRTGRWQKQNWTAGETYSTEHTDCAPQDLTIMPNELMAST
ncbi:hypothetical protein B0T14DRAFT_560393 [Immersiella caudata]|uniref:AA1-like domain-containing protein n=1 Tax=Immersiella caudata TaxID=314043 RepID=A0AA39XEZ8_9PEZI|nr:hypothetical protein B0T14DRAFT_560393 [Immersiella caudata]